MVRTFFLYFFPDLFLLMLKKTNLNIDAVFQLFLILLNMIFILYFYSLDEPNQLQPADYIIYW